MCTGGSCFVTDKGRDLKKARASRALEVLAEAVGFEPTVPFGTTVFKTASLSHSDTPPLIRRSLRLVQVAGDDPQDTTLPQRLGESPALLFCAAIVCARVNSHERARAIGPLSRTWRDFPISARESSAEPKFGGNEKSRHARALRRLKSGNRAMFSGRPLVLFAFGIIPLMNEHRTGRAAGAGRAVWRWPWKRRGLRARRGGAQ